MGLFFYCELLNFKNVFTFSKHSKNYETKKKLNNFSDLIVELTSNSCDSFHKTSKVHCRVHLQHPFCYNYRGLCCCHHLPL